MSNKECLRMYRVYKARLQNLLSEREMIILDEALPGAINYDGDLVQTSPTDQMANRVERIMARCKKIDEQIEWTEQRMQSIRDSINAMDDPDCMRLLWLRYIEGRQWSEIARIMSISEDHARGYLHGSALQKYQKVNTQQHIWG